MQAIPDFLATTDVGRRIPDVAEEDTQSWVSRREEMAEEKRLGGGLRWRNDSCALFLDAGPGEPQPVFFFCLFILACDLYRSWRQSFCPVFLSGLNLCVYCHDRNNNWSHAKQ